MGPASKRLRVIVTRAREQLEPLAGRIEQLGLEVVRCPLIELEAIGPDPVDVDGYDWVVVTSPFGARELLRRARGAFPQVAAIGPGTAAALAEGGVERRTRPGGLHPGRAPRGAPPASRPGALRRRGTSAAAPCGRARRRRRFALPHDRSSARPSARRRSRRARVGLRRGGFRRSRARAARGVDRSRDHASCRAGRRRGRRRGRTRTISTAWSKPSREPRSRTAGRARPARPPWSAPARPTP